MFNIYLKLQEQIETSPKDAQVFPFSVESGMTMEVLKNCIEAVIGFLRSNKLNRQGGGPYYQYDQRTLKLDWRRQVLSLRVLLDLYLQRDT